MLSSSEYNTTYYVKKSVIYHVPVDKVPVIDIC